MDRLDVGVVLGLFLARGVPGRAQCAMTPALWMALALASAGWIMNALLGIDAWVHRRGVEGSDHGNRIQALERELDAFHQKMSDHGDAQQKRIGGMELQIARMEEHLRYVDRRMDTHS